MIESSLVAGVELLSLDAGNVIIFLDHERLSRLLGRGGLVLSASALLRAEGEAKLAQEQGTMTLVSWEHEREPGAFAWGAMLATMMHRAGAPLELLASLLPMLWREHMELNLWSKVPEGLGAALDDLRKAGVPVVVLSNSEGKLEGLFTRLGIRAHFDHIFDSGLLGVEKPDLRIFAKVTELYGTPIARTLHVGDSIATDIRGGQAAGWRVALVDPFGHCEGRALDVPRVPGAREVAIAIVKHRQAPATRAATESP